MDRKDTSKDQEIMVMKTMHEFIYIHKVIDEFKEQIKFEEIIKNENLFLKKSVVMEETKRVYSSLAYENNAHETVNSLIFSI